MDDHRPPPSDVSERLEKAEQLKLEGKHKEALKLLEELLLEDPGNVAALEEVADNELSIECYDRAETAAKRAVSLDPLSYTGHYILGFLRSQESKWEEAAGHLREANKHKSNNAEILRCLGWALFNGGNRPQGVVTLERALNLESDNTFTLCDLGVAYLQLKRFKKSKALFFHALELDPDNPRARECVQAVQRLEKEMKKVRKE